jgi:hypothetical protein
MGEVENVVAGAGCARGVSATVPARAAAQASVLSVIGRNSDTSAWNTSNAEAIANEVRR